MQSEAIKKAQAKLEQAQAELEQALSDAKSAENELYETESKFSEMARILHGEMATIERHCTKATGAKDRAEKKGLWMTKAPTDTWAYNMEVLLDARREAVFPEAKLICLAVNVPQTDYEKAERERSQLRADLDVIKRYMPGTLEECRKLEQAAREQAK
jgi:hypothetical protein